MGRKKSKYQKYPIVKALALAKHPAEKVVDFFLEILHDDNEREVLEIIVNVLIKSENFQQKIIDSVSDLLPKKNNYHACVVLRNQLNSKTVEFLIKELEIRNGEHLKSIVFVLAGLRNSNDELIVASFINKLRNVTQEEDRRYIAKILKDCNRRKTANLIVNSLKIDDSPEFVESVISILIKISTELAADKIMVDQTTFETLFNFWKKEEIDNKSRLIIADGLTKIGSKEYFALILLK